MFIIIIIIIIIIIRGGSTHREIYDIEIYDGNRSVPRVPVLGSTA
jgi:hypothetical protein